jgi:hypothetical protein
VFSYTTPPSAKPLKWREGVRRPRKMQGFEVLAVRLAEGGFANSRPSTPSEARETVPDIVPSNVSLQQLARSGSSCTSKSSFAERVPTSLI